MYIIAAKFHMQILTDSAYVFNNISLKLLHWKTSTTKQAYAEFDQNNILEENVESRLDITNIRTAVDINWRSAKFVTNDARATRRSETLEG